MPFEIHYGAWIEEENHEMKVLVKIQESEWKQILSERLRVPTQDVEAAVDDIKRTVLRQIARG